MYIIPNLAYYAPPKSKKAIRKSKNIKKDEVIKVMKNDKVRVAKLYEKVFSTPVNSPEREQAYSALSESDKTAVFNLERDCMLGRITRQGIAEMKQEGNETMTYAQYKKIMDNDCKGQLRELSQFAKENQELYRQYSDRYGKEREAERKSRFTESTFKNKPYSFR